MSAGHDRVSVCDKHLSSRLTISWIPPTSAHPPDHTTETVISTVVFRRARKPRARNEQLSTSITAGRCDGAAARLRAIADGSSRGRSGAANSGRLTPRLIKLIHLQVALGNQYGWGSATPTRSWLASPTMSSGSFEHPTDARPNVNEARVLRSVKARCSQPTIVRAKDATYAVSASA
jgi:hypothetical protein